MKRIIQLVILLGLFVAGLLTINSCTDSAPSTVSSQYVPTP